MAAERTTLSGDAEHVYVTDHAGRIISTHDTLAEAQAAQGCACGGMKRLSRHVIDGVPGWVACPWCFPRDGSHSGSSDGEVDRG